MVLILHKFFYLIRNIFWGINIYWYFENWQIIKLEIIQIIKKLIEVKTIRITKGWSGREHVYGETNVN